MPDQTPDDITPRALMVFRKDDAPALRSLLQEHPELRARIQEPIGGFDSPLVTQARSAAMLDVLLDAGADINARSQWWAGGFGLLDTAPPELAAYAIRRGATVTAHAAARLGMIGKLRELVDNDPQLVHAPGGDGQTPLHFASTVEIAEYLLGRGAGIDARDVDHESTPAQYMLRDRAEVARFLVGRGCDTDILMAAALGDVEVAQKHLRADPECIRMRVTDEYFPKTNPHSGGTIYQWVLGWYVSAVQVAKAFGHTVLVDLLIQQSPAEETLLNACWLHDEDMVRALLAQQPGLATALPPAGLNHVARAARNNDTRAASLMLAAGLPPNAFGQHHMSALHWAAWHGNAELVGLLLARHPNLEETDNQYQATPLGVALHGSLNGWYRHKGDYAATVSALLDAGAVLPESLGGSDEVRAVLRQRGIR